MNCPRCLDEFTEEDSDLVEQSESIEDYGFCTYCAMEIEERSEILQEAIIDDQRHNII